MQLNADEINHLIDNGEEFIEHFGTKGMKWGVRKGKATTGVSRSTGAILDRNAVKREKLLRKKFKKGGEKFKLNEKFRDKMNTKLSDLDASDKRLKTGRTLTRDKLRKATPDPFFAALGILTVGGVPLGYIDRLVSGTPRNTTNPKTGVLSSKQFGAKKRSKK